MNKYCIINKNYKKDKIMEDKLTMSRHYSKRPNPTINKKRPMPGFKPESMYNSICTCQKEPALKSTYSNAPNRYYDDIIENYRHVNEFTGEPYVIGIVEFLGQYYNSTGSQYNYRLYDTDTIKVGDYVLCESAMGYRIGTLVAVTANPADYYINDNLIKRSIIGRIPECGGFIDRKLEALYAKDV
jgi:hypothetical protein